MTLLQRIDYLRNLRESRPPLRPVYDLHISSTDQRLELGRNKIEGLLQSFAIQDKKEEVESTLHCPNCKRQWSYCKDCKI